MRNFLKTIAVLAVFCASSFAQENAQESYEHYKSMKNVGTGLILGGAVFGTTGIVLSAAHFVKADDYVLYSSGGYNYFWDDEDADNYDKEVGKALGWFIASSLGYSAMIAGIPIRVVGRVKANEWKSKLPSAVYISPNGVKLAWNF